MVYIRVIKKLSQALCGVVAQDVLSEHIKNNSNTMM